MSMFNQFRVALKDLDNFMEVAYDDGVRHTPLGTSSIDEDVFFHRITDQLIPFIEAEEYV